MPRRVFAAIQVTGFLQASDQQFEKLLPLDHAGRWRLLAFVAYLLIFSDFFNHGYPFGDKVVMAASFAFGNISRPVSQYSKNVQVSSWLQSKLLVVTSLEGGSGDYTDKLTTIGGVGSARLHLRPLFHG